MRFGRSVVGLVLVVLVACDRPGPDQGPVQTGFCGLVTPALRSALQLGEGVETRDAHRQRCRYHTTALRNTGPVLALELVRRASDATATVAADAWRLAEAARRRPGAAGTTVTVAGRAVYQVVSLVQDGAAPLCSLFLTIGATSSLEARLTLPKDTEGCPDGGLTAALAAGLPPPADAARAPATSRPVDLATPDPCVALGPDVRRTLGLLDGIPDALLRSCTYYRVAPGELRFIGVLRRDQPATGIVGGAAERDVGGRPVHWTAGPLQGDDYPAASCRWYFEVSPDSSLDVYVVVAGHDPEPACRILAGLAPAIEAGLPLDTE